METETVLPGLFGRKGARIGLAVVLLVGVALPMGGSPAFAQDRDVAQLMMRLQDLEQQVRDLTGQVQGLQFQLTQLQTLVDRSNQDNNDRFRQLQGGAAPAPSGSAPAASVGTDNGGGVLTTQPPTRLGGRNAAAAPTNLMGSSDGTDGLGPSSDPLVGKGRAGVAPGAEEVPLGPSSGPSAMASQPVTSNAPIAAPGRPVLSAAAGGQQASIAPQAAAPASGDASAMAQYKAGYDALVKGNYPVAEQDFRAFIKQYPGDPQAADATNWLGEALLQQQDFVNAADVLVTGYKTYPDSPRAPDMLLKLGIALSGAQQPDAACKTFGLVASKYTNTTAAFRTLLKQQMAKANCQG